MRDIQEKVKIQSVEQLEMLLERPDVRCILGNGQDILDLVQNELAARRISLLKKWVIPTEHGCGIFRDDGKLLLGAYMGEVSGNRIAVRTEDQTSYQADATKVFGGKVIMKAYTADLGSWERGIVVDIEAKSPEEAYRKACDELSKSEKDGELPGDSMVVQIHDASDNGRCVYDFINSFSLYERMKE